MLLARTRFAAPKGISIGGGDSEEEEEEEEWPQFGQREGDFTRGKRQRAELCIPRPTSKQFTRSKSCPLGLGVGVRSCAISVVDLC